MRVNVLVEDVLFREALENLLGGLPGVTVVHERVPLKPHLAESADMEADTIVTPLEAHNAGALKALTELKRRTGVRLVGISSGARPPAASSKVFDQITPRSAGAQGLQQALNGGGAGSGARKVREAVAAYGSFRGLTAREQEAANLLSRGLTNRRIANVMGIREQSVKNLVSLIMRKLGCENRVQVALRLTGRPGGK